MRAGEVGLMEPMEGRYSGLGPNGRGIVVFELAWRSQPEMVLLTLVNAPPIQETLDCGQHICLKRLAV